MLELAIIKGKIERGDSQTLKKFIRTYLYRNKARIFFTIILIYLLFKWNVLYAMRKY